MEIVEFSVHRYLLAASAAPKKQPFPRILGVQRILGWLGNVGDIHLKNFGISMAPGNESCERSRFFATDFGPPNFGLPKSSFPGAHWVVTKNYPSF